MIEIWVGFSCVGISIIHQDAPRFGREMPIKQHAKHTLRLWLCALFERSELHTNLGEGKRRECVAILHKISYITPCRGGN